MAQIIQQRRDTAANWTQHNPILAHWEIWIETDNKTFKVWDWVSEWNSLDYYTQDLSDYFTKQEIAGKIDMEKTYDFVTDFDNIYLQI